MKTKESIKVGELLVEAQIVSSAEMTEAIQVSKRLATPIGRVLVMSGCVREDELEASLIAQKLIRSGEIALEAGVNALRRVHDRQISMSAALHNENIDAKLDEDPETFGELLVDSNIVSSEQLEKAMAQSFAEGVPLGSALVLQGVLSPNVFPSLLQIQKEISRGVTSRDEGVKEMQDTFLHWLKAEESLRRDRPHTFSDQISRQHELDEAWQAQSARHKDLSSHSFTQAEAKTPAPGFPGPGTRAAESVEPYNQEVEPQNTASHWAQAPQGPAPNPVQVAAAAENAAAAQETQAPAVKRSDELRLVDLLKRSGIFSQTDVQKRYEAMLKDPVRSGKFFQELGLLDEDDMKVAVRAHNLMTRGLLTQDEAIFALRGERVTDFEKQITDVDNTKVKRYMDKQWRGRMSKVLGGAIVGALVAGLSMSKRK